MIRGRRQEAYDIMKSNVDVTNMVTLGLSFSDFNGQRLGLHTYHFNLKFDVGREMSNPRSIDFLVEHGVNFNRLKKEGCDQKLVVDGLKCLLCDKSRKWLFFQGCKDMGYIIKVLTGQNLPQRVEDFLQLVEYYFPYFYDMKFIVTEHIMLREVSTVGLSSTLIHYQIPIPQVIHNSGSDALMTSDLYFFLKACLKSFRFFQNKLWSLYY